jgi:hypothetical protein
MDPETLGFEWLDPWYPLEDRDRRRFEGELRLELSPDHKLFGLAAVAIGGRKDRDDVLFRLDDGSGLFAVVHLSWRGQAESAPTLPFVSFYGGLRSWEYLMSVHHEDWWTNEYSDIYDD